MKAHRVSTSPTNPARNLSKIFVNQTHLPKTDYEKKQAKKIAENKAMLKSLGSLIYWKVHSPSRSSSAGTAGVHDR